MSTTTDQAAGAITAGVPLSEAQQYELLFWKERWPYRGWAVPQLQDLRHADGVWLLKNVGLQQRDEFSFDGFEGRVLEVGCGPIGFFELMRGVEVTAIDTLMAAYASEIPYSLLGTRGATTYTSRRLEEEPGTYKFVVCGNVLDYSDDWMEFLEAAVARVEPGGELILSTDTRTRPSVGHPQVFTAAQLKRALKWLGMRELRCFRADPPSNELCEHLVFVRGTP